jgi:hypothetical protein
LNSSFCCCGCCGCLRGQSIGTSKREEGEIEKRKMPKSDGDYLYECSATLPARIWPLAGVGPLVALQVALAGKCLWAISALIWPLARVRSQMDLHNLGGN